MTGAVLSCGLFIHLVVCWYLSLLLFILEEWEKLYLPLEFFLYGVVGLQIE